MEPRPALGREKAMVHDAPDQDRLHCIPILLDPKVSSDCSRTRPQLGRAAIGEKSGRKGVPRAISFGMEVVVEWVACRGKKQTFLTLRQHLSAWLEKGNSTRSFLRLRQSLGKSRECRGRMTGLFKTSTDPSKIRWTEAELQPPLF